MKPRARRQGEWLIAEVIGVVDEMPPDPVDLLLLTADELPSAAVRLARQYRAALLVALEQPARLHRTVDQQRAQIIQLREERRAAKVAA